MEGGRHPGLGTANRIVPLGDNYIELIAIVDPEEARTSLLSQRVERAFANGWRLAGWVLRTESVDREKTRLTELGEELLGPFERSRIRPDGSVLRWRMLFPADVDIGLPFFIEWQVPESEHPAAGQVDHPAGKVRIEKVTIETPELERAQRWIPSGIHCDIEPGAVSRVRAVALTHMTLQ